MGHLKSAPHTSYSASAYSGAGSAQTWQNSFSNARLRIDIWLTINAQTVRLSSLFVDFGSAKTGLFAEKQYSG